MKRLVKIEVQNFKAYLSDFQLSLPDGENMMIYGENGSGKSSLYEALQYFFDKSLDISTPSQPNFYSSSQNGQVKLTFIDTENGMDEQYYASFSNNPVDSHFSNFIRTSSLTKGFLDYTDLLALYLKKEDSSNFFDIFVKLIGNFVNPTSRNTASIQQKIKSFYSQLRQIKVRRGKRYEASILSLRDLDKEIRSILDDYFIILNTFLSKYFPRLDVELGYNLSPLTLSSNCPIPEAKIMASLTLSVLRNHKQISHYSQILNEARLSAIATCIYLSALKKTSQIIEYKILFLDDIFIGLDLGNRFPILELLKKEFSDYQIIISTYDRGWFNMARNILSSTDDSKWGFKEIYVGEETAADGTKIMKPIVIDGDDEISRAQRYLFEKYDYPAAANYFRKALEKLINDLFPKYIFRNENNELLQKYQLTKIIKQAIKFIQQIPEYKDDLSNLLHQLEVIYGFLPSLIHPLSHYSPEDPIYREEMLKVNESVVFLKDKLGEGDIFADLPIVLCEKGDIIFLDVTGLSGWRCSYTVKIEDNLYLYANNKGEKILSKADCYISKMEGVDENGNKLKTCNISKTSNLYNTVHYKSLQEFVDQTIAYIKGKGHTDIQGENKVSEQLMTVGNAEEKILLTDIIKQRLEKNREDEPSN